MRLPTAEEIWGERLKRAHLAHFRDPSGGPAEDVRMLGRELVEAVANEHHNLVPYLWPEPGAEGRSPPDGVDLAAVRHTIRETEDALAEVLGVGPRPR